MNTYVLSALGEAIAVVFFSTDELFKDKLIKAIAEDLVISEDDIVNLEINGNIITLSYFNDENFSYRDETTYKVTEVPNY